MKSLQRCYYEYKRSTNPPSFKGELIIGEKIEYSFFSVLLTGTIIQLSPTRVVFLLDDQKNIYGISLSKVHSLDEKYKDKLGFWCFYPYDASGFITRKLNPKEVILDQPPSESNSFKSEFDFFKGNDNFIPGQGSGGFEFL